MTNFADSCGIPTTLPELAWFMCDALEGLMRRRGLVGELEAFEMWSACYQRLQELSPRGGKT
jgi:hypothetical protein